MGLEPDCSYPFHPADLTWRRRVVKQGDVLFTIDSPDLVAAESSLIAAAGVLQLSTRALERARTMFESQSIAQKDLDQATSDQQTAQANLEAARAAVWIFGKSEAEIARRRPAMA